MYMAVSTFGVVDDIWHCCQMVADNCQRLGVSCVSTVASEELEPFLEGGFDRFQAPSSQIGWLQGYLAHRKTTGEPRIQKMRPPRTVP